MPAYTPLITLQGRDLANVLDLGRFTTPADQAAVAGCLPLTHILVAAEDGAGCAVAVRTDRTVAVARLTTTPARPFLLDPGLLSHAAVRAGAGGRVGDVAISQNDRAQTCSAAGSKGALVVACGLPAWAARVGGFPDWRDMPVTRNQWRRQNWTVSGAALADMLKEADKQRPAAAKAAAAFDESLMLHIHRGALRMTHLTAESAVLGHESRKSVLAGTSAAEAAGRETGEYHIRLHRDDLLQAALLSEAGNVTLSLERPLAPGALCLHTSDGVRLFQQTRYCDPVLFPADRRRAAFACELHARQQAGPELER